MHKIESPDGGFKTHLFQYRYKGERYGFEIPARTPEEAQERLQAMMWAKYDGELALNIPVSAGNALVRLYAHARSLLLFNKNK